jgi:hypothetical protein
MTPSGIEPATSRLVVHCLNHLRQCMPLKKCIPCILCVTLGGSPVRLKYAAGLRRLFPYPIVYCRWFSLQNGKNVLNEVIPLCTESIYSFIIYKGRGKAVPLQAWSGLEGSRKLWFPDYMKTAQDGSKVVSLMHRPPLPPGNVPGTNFC